MVKCKEGFMRSSGKCVKSFPKKYLGNFYKDYSIIKLALIISLTSIGGWAMFTGIVKIFNLGNIGGLWMLVLGIGVVFLTYKLGLKDSIRRNKLIK